MKVIEVSFKISSKSDPAASERNGIVISSNRLEPIFYIISFLFCTIESVMSYIVGVTKNVTTGGKSVT